MEKPKVSIVIPAHNEERLIEDCLASIVAHTPREWVEVILVDNSSSDSTRERARAFAGVKVFEEENKGVMHARQKGYMESRGDIVVFVDADNVITPEWIHGIMRHFERDPKIVCVTGPYDYYDLSAGKRWLAALHWNIVIYTAYSLIGYVGNFGNMALRRSALEKMGGLDTSIVFYGDDTATAREAKRFGKVKYDLGLKIHSSGRRFNHQGLFKTTMMYAANFFSQAFFKRSVTKTYQGFK